MMKDSYDIVIVGGGMAGASLARALSPLPWSIAVLEAQPPGAPAQPSYDERTTALSYSSRMILEALGIWEALASDTTPIRTIHVSERGRFGAARFHCEEEGVEAFGYVVPNRALGVQLHAGLGRQDNVDVITPARVSDLVQHPDAVVLQVGQGPGGGDTQAVRARLVVAADGMESFIRSRMEVRVSETDYGQTAVVANVTPGRFHDHVAYERFTPDGPIALLPVGRDRCALVWTHPEQSAARVLELDDRQFLEALQQAFGYRLGRFRQTGPRSAYPLKLVQVNRHRDGRIVLLGNAAHSVHPVGGQGFNLALREVALLAELMAGGMAGGDPGDARVLDRFEQRFREDLERTVRLTDTLARLFVIPWPPLGVLRSLGLVALDLVPPLRRRFVRMGMGVSGRPPALAVGIPPETVLAGTRRAE